MTPRKALAEVICGRTALWPTAPAIGAEDWLQLARAEEVVALADKRMRDRLEGTPMAVRRTFSDAARGEAAQSIVASGRDPAGPGAFRPGRPVLLPLKGSALAWWAYSAPHLRRCADVDLLFATREDALTAAGMLAAGGYKLRQPFGPAATREFRCRRDGPSGESLEMDMHWGLCSAPVFADRLSGRRAGVGPGAAGAQPTAPPPFVGGPSGPMLFGQEHRD